MASSGRLVGPIVAAGVGTGKRPVVDARLLVDKLRDRGIQGRSLPVTERVDVPPRALRHVDKLSAAQLGDRG
jgi:hypothetical protein